MSNWKPYIIRQGLAEDIDKAHAWIRRGLFDDLAGRRPRVWIHAKPSNKRIAVELLRFDRRIENALDNRYEVLGRDSKDDFPFEPIKTEKGNTTESASNVCRGDLLLSAWQRHGLGITEKDFDDTRGYWSANLELGIEPCTNSFSNLQAAWSISRNHPQVVVRCAFWLGVIGLAGTILSFLGLVVSLLSWACGSPSALGKLFCAALPCVFLCLLGLVLIFPIWVVIRSPR